MFLFFVLLSSSLILLYLSFMFPRCFFLFPLLFFHCPLRFLHAPLFSQYVSFIRWSFPLYLFFPSIFLFAPNCPEHSSRSHQQKATEPAPQTTKMVHVGFACARLPGLLGDYRQFSAADQRAESKVWRSIVLGW